MILDNNALREEGITYYKIFELYIFICEKELKLLTNNSNKSTKASFYSLIRIKVFNISMEIRAY